ncbi:MAG: MOSC domain-containing protein [Solirubrobacteraceae bacterium]
MTTEATLTAVNVGLPREVRWRGRAVRTAIWKAPVPGRVHVGGLNVDGDGQADLVGHGGEHRAVFVYQRDSYRYWARELGRSLEPSGQFGENFTVDGLGDDEVHIGDRYAIGSAVFEVTQPRVTCFKVGMRLDEPRMPALLTGHGRPGFYLRVIAEGDVGAGDRIRLLSRDPRSLSVRRTSDLLYRPGPDDAADLRRIVAVPALAEGWRGSFRALLERDGAAAGNTGLTAPTSPPAWSGYRPFAVAEAIAETDEVRSLLLVPAEPGSLPAHRPGQFVSVRLPGADGAALVRSYSLSAAADGRRLRISVKREGRASALVHALAPGDVVDVAAPRGAFTIDVAGERPVLLASAGIGVTPLLAMLGALAKAGSRRPVTWVHVARSGRCHALAREARALLAALPAARIHVRYTRPDAADMREGGFDATGRLSAEALDALGPDLAGEAFVCGPDGFMAQVTADMLALGFAPGAVHTEAFGAAAPQAAAAYAPDRPPHEPPGRPAEGPAVTFARAGLTVRWGETDGTLLELAEACDVPAEWSCRTGVCHRCQSGLVEGAVDYDPEPLDPPPAGSALLCCSRPRGDVTIDL